MPGSREELDKNPLRPILTSFDERPASKNGVDESQPVLHSISEALPCWVYIFDLDAMGIAYSNRSILADLGFPVAKQNADQSLASFTEFMTCGSLGWADRK